MQPSTTACGWMDGRDKPDHDNQYAPALPAPSYKQPYFGGSIDVP
jgi:hypothetical protein